MVELVNPEYKRSASSVPEDPSLHVSWFFDYIPPSPHKRSPHLVLQPKLFPLEFPFHAALSRRCGFPGLYDFKNRLSRIDDSLHNFLYFLMHLCFKVLLFQSPLFPTHECTPPISLHQTQQTLSYMGYHGEFLIPEYQTKSCMTSRFQLHAYQSHFRGIVFKMTSQQTREK